VPVRADARAALGYDTDLLNDALNGN